jgi:hypothetical protein
MVYRSCITMGMGVRGISLLGELFLLVFNI